MLQTSITGSAEASTSNTNHMANAYGMSPGPYPGGHMTGPMSMTSHQGYGNPEPQPHPHPPPSYHTQSPMAGNHSYTYGANSDSHQLSTMDRYSERDPGSYTPSITPTHSYSTAGTARSDHTASMRTDSLYRSSKRGRLMQCKVQMLDDTVMSIEVPHNSIGAELFLECCKHINLYELDYFGVEYYTKGGKMVWVEPEKPLVKQVDSPKKTLFHFSVKFYIADPGQLHDEFTKYLFGLQVKKDLANGRLPCSENTAALMASYILQAEVGDYNPVEHEDGQYIKNFRFIPSQQSSMESKIQEYHKNHIGQTPADADFNLLDVARRLEMYGVRLYPARDYENVQLSLAVCHQGVLVFQNNQRINTFSWAKIRKVSFKRKRFLVKLHPEGFGYPRSTVEFLMGVRNDCKRFWKACVEHHTFFRLSKPGKPRVRTRLMSRGSTFRFSGKTQKQVVETLRQTPSRPVHGTMSLNASRTSSRSLGAPRTTTPLAIDMTETIVSDHQSTPNLSYPEAARQNGTPQSESASSPPSSTPVTPKHDNSRITIHKGQSVSSITYEYTVTEDQQRQASPTATSAGEKEVVSATVEPAQQKEPTANGDTQRATDSLSEQPSSYTRANRSPQNVDGVLWQHGGRGRGSSFSDSESEDTSSGREKIILWEPNRLLVYSYGEEKSPKGSRRQPRRPNGEGETPAASQEETDSADTLEGVPVSHWKVPREGRDVHQEARDAPQGGDEESVRVSDTLDEVLRIVSKLPDDIELDSDLPERGQTPSLGGDSRPDSPMEFQLNVGTSTELGSFREERQLFFPSTETVTSSLQEVNSGLDDLERSLDLDIEKQAEIQRYVRDVTESVLALQNMDLSPMSPKSPPESSQESPKSPSNSLRSPPSEASLAKEPPLSPSRTSDLVFSSPKRESYSSFDVSPRSREQQYKVNTGLAVVHQKHTIILKSRSSDDEGERYGDGSYVSEMKLEVDNRGRISVDEDSIQSPDVIPSDVAEVSYSEVFSDSEVSFGRLENEPPARPLESGVEGEGVVSQEHSLPLSVASLSDIESDGARSSEDEAVYQYKLKAAKMSRHKASLTDTISSGMSSSEDEDGPGRIGDSEGDISGSPILSPSKSITANQEHSAPESAPEDENHVKKVKRHPPDKAYFIAKEILTTERTYLKDLEVIVVWFRRAAANEVTQPDMLENLFEHLEPIYEFHCKFLKEIEQRLTSWEGRANAELKGSYQGVGDIMLKNVQHLKVYNKYLENLEEILNQVESLVRKNKSFETFYREFEVQKVCYLPFNTFLLKPLQRLLHYQLILDRLVKYYPETHPDFKDCKAAVAEVGDLTTNLVDDLKQISNFLKLTELQRDLVGMDNLVQPGRHFIREGCLHKLSRKGYQQRMFFLFSDMLLYTSKGVTSSNQFKVHGQIPLKGVVIEDSELDRSVANCFTLYGGNKTVVIAASNPDEKDRWMSDIKSAMALCQENDTTTITTPDQDSAFDESEDDVSSPSRSLERQSQHRANTTVPVCWHRNTSVSMSDHIRAVQNQLSGFLLRKFKNSNGWQKLWVVFTNFCLFFYKSHQEDYPLASLPLLGYTITQPGEEDEINKDYVFKLQFKTHVYFFRAESEYTYNRWLEVLKTATYSSKVEES